MRNTHYRMDEDHALALLRRVPAVHVAGVADDGKPVLKTVHAVLMDGWMAFHGAPAGEKMELLGRPVVMGAEEIFAEIPSHFVDPERACPATTFYESAQLHGTLTEIDDVKLKARVLQALMERFQPEGGHVPITHDHVLYEKVVKGLLVCGVRVEGMTGKGKLGQNRTPEQRTVIAEKLWKRGLPSDVRTLERMLEANGDAALPAFLQGPQGTRLHAHLDERHACAAAQLAGVTEEEARGWKDSSAWVGALDEQQRLVGTARAVSDGKTLAIITDVVVEETWKASGLEEAMLVLLCDHPTVRHVPRLEHAHRRAA